MSIYHLPNSELISLGHQTLINSQTSPLKEAVARVGYNKAAFKKARKLLDTFDDDVKRRYSELGLQMIATEKLHEAREAFHRKTYMPHVTIARLEFGKNGTLEHLGITGSRPTRLGDYIHEARRFYRTIAGDKKLQKTFAFRGVTAETVRQARADLDELETLSYKQEQQKAAAQEATRRRNKSRRAFADWLSKYRKFARIAMTEEPELLEQIGIKVPSGR